MASTRTTTARSGTRRSTSRRPAGQTGAPGSASFTVPGMRPAASLHRRRRHRLRRHRRRPSPTSTTDLDRRGDHSQNFEIGSRLRTTATRPTTSRSVRCVLDGRRRRCCRPVLQRRRAGGLGERALLLERFGQPARDARRRAPCSELHGRRREPRHRPQLSRWSRERHVLGVRAGEPRLRPERPVGLDDPLSPVRERRGLQERGRRLRNGLHELDAKR